MSQPPGRLVHPRVESGSALRAAALAMRSAVNERLLLGESVPLLGVLN